MTDDDVPDHPLVPQPHADDDDRERPDDCECGSLTAGPDPEVDIPCLVCWIAGFETTNPDAVDSGE